MKYLLILCFIACIFAIGMNSACRNSQNALENTEDYDEDFTQSVGECRPDCLLNCKTSFGLCDTTVKISIPVSLPCYSGCTCSWSDPPCTCEDVRQLAQSAGLSYSTKFNSAHATCEAACPNSQQTSQNSSPGRKIPPRR